VSPKDRPLQYLKSNFPGIFDRHPAGRLPAETRLRESVGGGWIAGWMASNRGRAGVRLVASFRLLEELPVIHLIFHEAGDDRGDVRESVDAFLERRSIRKDSGAVLLGRAVGQGCKPCGGGRLIYLEPLVDERCDDFKLLVGGKSGGPGSGGGGILSGPSTGKNGGISVADRWFYCGDEAGDGFHVFIRPGDDGGALRPFSRRAIEGGGPDEGLFGIFLHLGDRKKVGKMFKSLVPVPPAIFEISFG
jgi:hypothetical protein